jgi:hypothetical protein
LNACYSTKCDETFYNKIKSRFVNKKGWNDYFFIVKILFMKILIFWINMGAFFVIINFVFKVNWL